MHGQRKIAVVGATGRVGHHVVDVLEARGHDVVRISRTDGVDVVTGAGLPEALSGVESVIDAATGASPEQQAATEFFTAAARNLQQAGDRAGRAADRRGVDHRRGPVHGGLRRSEASP